MSEPSASKTHPVLFLILFLPSAIANGYVAVTLAYLLSQAGVSVLAIAGLSALYLAPLNFKMLWAPLVDTTLTTKRWFVISTVLSSGMLASMALIPATPGNLLLFDVLVVVLSIANTFNMMAVDALMAHATAPEEKGRAAGWSQAGALGGTGLGGGAGLWIATHVHQAWVSGAALGVACTLCCIALIWAKEPEGEHRSATYWISLVQVGRECWELISSRLGFLAVFIMLLPMGSGGAQNLWAAIAGDWHASADTVALVNGVMGGAVTMIGCIAGGFVSDRIDRKTAYCVFGLVIAAVAAAMALAPRSEMMFAVFTLVYAFALGLCYGAFCAVTLEAIGAGAAATKYNIIAGLANAPLAYEALIDGWAQTHYGSGGMLYVEGLLGVLAVVLFAGMAMLTRGRFRRETPAYAL